jgi:flavin-dependent dehydrogenase
VVWSRAVRPGYGWIFPAPDGCFNIGVGVTDSHRAVAGEFGKRGAKKELNLREIFDAFVKTYEPAAALMREGEMIGELKGAPLRCTLEGARWSRPGLLVTGEAAGSTYSFTGEGIGKALETGMLAAEAILAAGGDADVRSRYEQSLRALKPKFDLYQRANKVNAHPWLVDLLIWRAQRSARLLKRMSGVLNETSNPGNLVSVKGFTRLFLDRG